MYIIYKHCCFYHEVGGTFLSPKCVFLVQQMRGEKLFYEVIYEAVFLTSLKFYYFGPSFKRKCHQIQYQLPVAKAFAINIFYISICSTVLYKLTRHKFTIQVIQSSPIIMKFKGDMKYFHYIWTLNYIITILYIYSRVLMRFGNLFSITKFLL